VRGFRFSKDKETGRFRGIAFVTFPSIDIAESAVRNLNQVALNGRDIFLDFSRGDRGRDRDRVDRGPDLREWAPDLRSRPGRDRTRDGIPSEGHDPRYGGGAPGPQQFHQYQQMPPQQQAHTQGPYGGQAQGSVITQSQPPHTAGPGGMMAQQGQPQGMIFAPQGQAQGQVLPQTIIVQADGRQVILQPGQQPPVGMIQQISGLPMGAIPQGSMPMPAQARMPEGRLQGEQQMVHVQMAGQGVIAPGVGQPMLAAPAGGAPGLPQHAAAVLAAHVKAPSELQPDLPVGQATAMHVCFSPRSSACCCPSLEECVTMHRVVHGFCRCVMCMCLPSLAASQQRWNCTPTYHLSTGEPADGERARSATDGGSGVAAGDVECDRGHVPQAAARHPDVPQRTHRG
jgi:hypothetical protein